MFLYFYPLWVSQIPEKTPNHPKKIFIFAPFWPILSRFAPVRGAPIVQSRPGGCRCSQCCTIKQGSGEAHNPTRPEGTRDKGQARERGDKQHHPPTRQANKERNERKSRSRERERGRERERERTTEPANKSGRGGAIKRANKERVPPPIGQGTGRCSPHHKFAPKNQQKVAWVSFEKIFGKIFRWNVSVECFGGKKNPLRYLNERGDDCLINLVNENRKISNLAMQINQKLTKALKPKAKVCKRNHICKG